MPATVEELGSGDGMRIGALGNMVISVFNKPLLPSLELLEGIQARLVEKHGRVVSMTVIVGDKLEAPNSDFRARSAKVYDRFEPTLICSVVIITSTGISAVVARTFMAAWQLLVSYKKPQKTFRQVSDAVAWIHTLSPQPEGAAQAIEVFVKGG